MSEFVVNSNFPKVDPSTIDLIILKKNEYLNKVGSNLRSTFEKFR